MLCGTADCLEALGVNISQSPERCIELLNEVGMCFFFAQKYHTSMKYVGAIRRELGFRTVFNILGPLTNPGSPSMQLLGVYDEYLVTPLAQVLSSLGVTGVRTEIRTDLGAIVEVVRQNTGIPCAVGFGISTPGQAAKMAAISDGAIIGSAVVKILEQYGKEAPERIAEYVRQIKAAIR